MKKPRTIRDLENDPRIHSIDGDRVEGYSAYLADGFVVTNIGGAMDPYMAEACTVQELCDDMQFVKPESLVEITYDDCGNILVMSCRCFSEGCWQCKAQKKEGAR